MNGLLKIRKEMKEMQLVIDGYCHENQHVPSDIQQMIHKTFVRYYWKCNTLFESDSNELGEVVESCVNEIYGTGTFVHGTMNPQQVMNFFRMQNMNGTTFCSMGKRNWITLFTNNNVCSMGVAIRLWIKIHQFDFSIINVGSPMY